MLNIILAIITASSYVVSIYYNKPTYLIGRDRNDLLVIRYRLKRISLLCIVLTLGIPYVLVYLKDYPDYFYVIRKFGLVPGYTILNGLDQDLLNCLKCLRLVLILYVGPIWKYLMETNWSIHTLVEDFREDYMTIYGVRDHLFAPITEELIYRSIILTILEPVSTRRSLVIFGPLLFGIAHIHHGYELYTVKKLPLSMVIFNGIVQTIYTTLFGILTNHLYLKYSNVWGCIIVHSICNLIGFPEIGFKTSNTHKYIYYILLLVGIYGFFKYI